MTIRRAIAFGLTILTVASCSSSFDTVSDETIVVGESTVIGNSPVVDIDPGDAIEWTSCSLAEAECAVVEVPFDHERPESGNFDILIARHRARSPDERIGVLFTNTGGPGAEAIWLAKDADLYFSDEILDRFDIVGWDPRGTSGARPEFDCTDEIDAYFALDPSPDSSADREGIVEAARDFVDSCVVNAGRLLPYIGTEAAARDIDFVRRLLGEDKVSYFGFSYGSELGATWSTLFPGTVRAAVFDAAADPNLDVIDWSSFQIRGFERTLDSFLDDCDAIRCEFMAPGEDARTSFDRLMSDLNRSPLMVTDDRPLVGRGVALTAVFTALYSKTAWSSLDVALADAARGIGDRLLTMYDNYFGGWRDGHTDNSIDSYIAITCLDRRRSFEVAEAFEAMDEVRLVAPRLGAVVLHELLLCAQWPVDPTPPAEVRWTGDVPILVVGSTGDPATPLAGTRRMYETLGNARLVVVDSFEHTSYGSNECATEAVDRYLVDLVVHDGELAC